MTPRSVDTITGFAMLAAGAFVISCDAGSFWLTALGAYAFVCAGLLWTRGRGAPEASP